MNEIEEIKQIREQLESLHCIRCGNCYRGNNHCPVDDKRFPLIKRLIELGQPI